MPPCPYWPDYGPAACQRPGGCECSPARSDTEDDGFVTVHPPFAQPLQPAAPARAFRNHDDEIQSLMAERDAL